MKHNNIARTLATLLVVGLLAGCNLPISTGPVVTAPTLDTTAMAGTVAVMATQVASTLSVKSTLDTALNPSTTPTQAETATLAPSSTQAVTDTPTSAPATDTVTPPPTLTPFPTQTFIPLPTSTTIPTDYTCSITKTTPAFGTKLTPGVDFDGRWTVKNMGTETWLASDVDYVYVSGTKTYKKKDAYDTTTDVDPGNSFDVIVDMIAPKPAGTYTTTWGLRRGGAIFCYMSIRFVVK